MREVIVTGKTVEEATEAACQQLGLPREEVSIEILEMPVQRLFKRVPAKVRAQALEPQLDPIPTQEPVVEQEPVCQPEPQPAAQEQADAPQAEEENAESKPVDTAANPKLAAAMEYLTQVFALMGAENLTIWAEQQGEAYIIKVEGDEVGVLIGHRGETMESLSYLAGLVANRLEGDYLKLGLDVAGYRSKREKDLEALAQRLGAKVLKNGRSHSMEPMNPYERRIIHSVIGAMEGVHSESKGEGTQRRVVIYPDQPRQSAGRSAGRSRSRKPGQRSERRSQVPGRTFAQEQRDENAKPVAPKRTQVIDDAEGFALYGKIEL